MDDISNYAMKSGFSANLAAPAPGLIAASGYRRVLWAATCLGWELDIHA